MVPDAWDLNVSLAHGGPTLAAWRGASDFASDWGAYQSRAVTKKMYEEMGSERLLEAWRFQVITPAMMWGRCAAAARLARSRHISMHVLAVPVHTQFARGGASWSAPEEHIRR